jgi:putative FmdB family regulatory protein
MPIYEYCCGKCGQVNEFIIIGKQEQLKCKGCGSEDLTKLLSAHNVSANSSRNLPEPGSGGCCGTPNSCGNPGSCCSG